VTNVTAAQTLVRTGIAMDTLISIEMQGRATSAGIQEKVGRALGWFAETERICSRFDPGSELCRLSATTGFDVPVSQLLFAALSYALAVARASGGAFDPTVGRQMVRRGFATNFRLGADPGLSADVVAGTSFEDVVLLPESRSVHLLKPLTLDLGAVAKGLAIDLAAFELAEVGSFAVFAGGDLRVRGHNSEGEPWSIGLRHAQLAGEIDGTIRTTDAAVCASGADERRAPADQQGHHIIDPATGQSPEAVAAVTVVAPTALVADALATAAFVLGPGAGLRFLEEQAVEGRIVTDSLTRYETRGFRGLVR